MTFAEKINPTTQSYSTQEIAEGLKMPAEMINKLKRIGLITPELLSDDHYSFKTVKFIEQYWSANAAKMLNVKP
ncbi:MAG: hypothetical protein A2268_16375 [Candidatus Raymondbacteria bacterium RifOxyA12_full_50_37]|uniref:HTH merR-type domain-containing protein n=1 Tax=Candidatus Raymondbacteria bacterium RIFOXYD12_FULL_49_13 TaxID=1817890 RepID=A0A1F7F833_UNCRA|nr:MAG: hypothetical protein A2268_16375 [Candidatus Raymondbacteria bacterium RifOxyA12_full_50_37]OGJ94374.1 MAG: hypothetical protein A2248_14570 [Candidatus Raymondbacteria bacterium RIFOXYA2_FULL_49_16]OGJ95135.1 MAG: hypothetical protein A2350_09325 [Candidatus Raymondbacteria bacterium RifOxyB12_full_50_8]OGJ95316.1 MAG: hypothetical protein A2453_05995 [Candidatus Raymondbacteria bacterium RIFOXYC2_FULL_50_21]OGJ99798.1 MAG: hypothetical protein A2487_10695 [Candidatus Raymondbacteria b